jgi:hypothetical protein
MCLIGLVITYAIIAVALILIRGAFRLVRRAIAKMKEAAKLRRPYSCSFSLLSITTARDLHSGQFAQLFSRLRPICSVNGTPQSRNVLIFKLGQSAIAESRREPECQKTALSS